jgi:hypothetical protein
MAEATDVAEELLQEIKKLLQEYVADPDLYPSDWKHIVTRLQRIANQNPLSPFDLNSKAGFNYLEICVMCRVCDKCGDIKAFEWMKVFARAWLDGAELPKFCHSCFFNEEESE